MTEKSKKLQQLIRHDVVRMEFFDRIDYELLRQQKLMLLDMVMVKHPRKKVRQLVDGLVGLLDSLQDTAVECGMSEEAVFGKEDENE